MNKVFNINLGGYPFTIDEDAYEHLSNYLRTIHNHFRDSEGYEEITSDIETRMAELFQENLDSRPIVTLSHTQDAIAIMGTPEDFGAEPIEEEAPKSSKSSKDKFEFKPGKKLYRNSEDEVIAGVCSGVASYLGVQDPLWVRLAFLLIVLSGGIGIPVYLILWAILPVAETASDRLAMRGDPINVSNIGKIIEEEMDHFSVKMTALGDELKEEFGSKKKSFFRTGAEGSEAQSGKSGRKGLRGALKKGIYLLGKIVKTVFKTIFQIWKPIAFIVGVALIIAFAVFWIASIIGLFYGYSFFGYLIPNSTIFSLVGITNFLVVLGIPLVALILFVTRVFFRSHIRPLWRSGLWGFWALNLASLAAIVGFTTKDFQSGRELVQYEMKDIVSADTLTISLGENPYNEDWGFLIDGLQISGNELVSEDISIYVEKSESGFFELEQKTNSRGEDSEEALQLATNIGYQISIEDNHLILPPNFLIPKGTKWRNQKVKLYLKVPEGKHLKFEGRAGRKIHRMEVDEDFDYPWIYSDKGYIWRMTPNGLVCPEYIDELSQDYEIQDFSKIHITGEIEVNINQGEIFEVSLKDKCNCAEDIDIIKIGERLDITTNRHIHGAVLNITMPSLEVLDIKDAKTINVRGFMEETMDIWIDNDHNRTVKAFLDVENLTIRQKGNHNLELIGEGNSLNATLERNADLDAKKYIVKTANITAPTRNDIELSVSDTLRQNIDRDVKLKVGGEPIIIDVNAEDNEEIEE